LRQARLLARSLTAKTGSDAETFTVAAFEQVLTRPPTRDELVECVSFLSQRMLRYSQGGSPSPAETDPTGKAPARDPSLRSRENLVHVLMNHNDFVMIR
jgi:hypothetical protein